MRIFYDFEFCGFHKGEVAQPISLACVCSNGNTFYAEFIDFPADKINDWIEQNVLPSLRWYQIGDYWQVIIAAQKLQDTFIFNASGLETYVLGSKHNIRNQLKSWIKRQYDPAETGKIHFWGDYCTHDWQMLTDLIANFDNNGGLPVYPDKVSYIPYDLSTLLAMQGKQDISREGYAGVANYPQAQKHNALWDAAVIKACYNKIIKELFMANPNFIVQ